MEFEEDVEGFYKSRIDSLEKDNEKLQNELAQEKKESEKLRQQLAQAMKQIEELKTPKRKSIKKQ